MIWLLALGCTGDDVPHTPLMDTGWFTETDAPEAIDCTDKIIETAPEAGATDWYWRDPLTAAVSSVNAEAYPASLRSSDGPEVAGALGFDGQVLTFQPNEPLRPSASYQWVVEDCLGPHVTAFTTSDLGTPLAGGPSAVVHRTYQIELSKANWVAPKGFGTILALYFTTPLLIGVDWADTRIVDLIGAPGGVTTSGAVVQDTTQATWDFPIADFGGAPWFQAATDKLSLNIEGVTLDIHQFTIEATFAADASRLGGGVVEGLADTRKLGPLLGSPDDEAAVCKLAATLGATCEPCPDGEVYCLEMSARDVSAARLDGVAIRRIDAE
jgi:hypothetical protein